MKIGPIFLVIFLTDKQTEEVKTLPHPAIYPLSLSLSLSLSLYLCINRLNGNVVSIYIMIMRLPNSKNFYDLFSRFDMIGLEECHIRVGRQSKWVSKKIYIRASYHIGAKSVP